MTNPTSLELAAELERRWSTGCTVGGMLETRLSKPEQAAIIAALRAQGQQK